MASVLRNNFSWSFSRHKVFEECRRRYFLQYYGSWNGWNADGPERARLAYRLKNMQALPMWVGSIVHRIAERILGDLRNREHRDLAAYQKQARDIMNREWKQSLDGEWMHKPKYNLNLFEHYYGIEITAEERMAAKEKVFACLERLMSGDIFAEVGALRPAEWKSIEKLDQFTVGRHPVFVKIDCATRTEPVPGGAAGRLRIYDWKTGKETEDAAAQLGCYALYALQVWRVPLEEVELVLAYLASGETHRLVPAAADVLRTQDFMMASMDAMIATLDSSAEENVATQAKFPLTTRRSNCRRCFFREICFGTREWRDGIEPVEA